MDKKKVTRQSISNNIEKTNCTLFLFRVQSADHEERERERKSRICSDRTIAKGNKLKQREREVELSKRA